MITAIDTSVLYLIARQEPGWERWAKALCKAAQEGPLVVCCVVFGEWASFFESHHLAMEHLRALNIHYDPILPTTAAMAHRKHLDFAHLPRSAKSHFANRLIAAHAEWQADRLAVATLTDPGSLFDCHDFLYP
jgi:predicted nucleic acid-binding protein